MLDFKTAGESHGPQLTAILSGFPAGVLIDEETVNLDLARRQKGYGRGGRMKIEKDKVRLLSGVRFSRTLGSPITLVIKNRDYENWLDVMSPLGKEPEQSKKVTRPRPGHADLAGALKFAHKDARNILERSSARETAARVAVGAVCKCLLTEFSIELFSHVVCLGGVEADVSGLAFSEIKQKAEASDVRCADAKAAQKMKEKIDDAKKKGDTLGGIAEIVATGVPVGLGNVMNWEEKLDGLLAQAVMSIPSVKGVEAGMGFQTGRVFGSEVHDAISYSDDVKKLEKGRGPSGGFYHETNNAGGIEGGMTNGEAVIVRAAFKPIPTMMKPKLSVDLETKEPFEASKERSDVCAVPAAGVVAEAMTAFVLTNAFIAKFGGDSLEEIRRNYNSYVQYLEDY